MNEIDLLKRVRTDVPDPDPVALARARRRLLTSGVARRRPVTLRRTLIAGTLAATLAGGFLINDVVSTVGAPRPGAIADAGTFLASAATLTSGSHDAAIPAGQYLQLTQRHQYTWTFGPWDSYQGTRLDVTNYWIGADQKAPYTGISVLGAKREFSSGAARRLWLTTDPLNAKPQTIKSRRVCGVLTTSGLLTVPEGSKNSCRPTWYSPSPEFLAGLPRDPHQLLARLRKSDGPGTGPVQLRTAPPDTMAFDRAGLVLASGVAPADLRAAVYEAVRLMRGIHLQDDAVNLDGKAGRAVSQVQQFGLRKELIIDPRTGQFLGLRTVATITGPLNGKGDPMSYKRGDVVNWTSVSTRITPTRPAV